MKKRKYAAARKSVATANGVHVTMTIFREMKRLGNMQLSHLHGCALLLSSLSFNCLVKHNSALPSISFSCGALRPRFLQLREDERNSNSLEKWKVNRGERGGGDKINYQLNQTPREGRRFI
jgi:hypothetical protein